MSLCNAVAIFVGLEIIRENNGIGNGLRVVNADAADDAFEVNRN